MVRVTNKHRLGRALRRSGSGSFAAVEAVKRVKRCRVNDGLNPSNYTDSCIETYLWGLAYVGKFTVRQTEEGIFRFKPTPAVANILRAARAQFSGKASTLKIGTYILSKVGPIPTLTKRQLFVFLYEKGLMNAAAAPAESEDGEDIGMDVDSGGVQEEVPELGGSDSVQGGTDEAARQPQTPQRSRPAQGHYPTPPNTTSPLARYHSRVSVNGVDLHDSHVGSFVPGVMDPGGSGGSRLHAGANTGLPGDNNAECARPECQQREQEYQRTRLDLEVAQADAAEQRDELLVLKLLQIDMEDRLVDAQSRNGNLADECLRYKKKCSGAEAALQSSQAVVHSMQNKMAEYLAHFRFM